MTTTLEASDKAVADEYNSQEQRGYLGMSSIGDECARKLWYRFRNAKQVVFDAKSVKRFLDGHTGEEVMADRLRKVPGIVLITEDDNGKQKEYSDFNGHFSGHSDGDISGLLENPNMHIWENKNCNEKTFNDLIKLKELHGELNALKKWDATYYAQAQLYMHYSQIHHHYMTVNTPGNRDSIECFTPYNEKDALRLIEKAERIIFSDDAPVRLSENPAWFQCKMCDMRDICHQKTVPETNCRTCLHSTPERDGGWSCAIGEWKETGCEKHLYLPDMLSGKAVSASEEKVCYEDGRVNHCGGRVE